MAHVVKPAASPFGSAPGWDLTFVAIGRDAQARLELALVASLIAHVVFILGFSGIGVPTPFKPAEPELTVELVNARTQTAPQKADILAQHNLDGGGNTDADRRIRTPLPVTPRAPDPDVSLNMRRAPTREIEPPPVMTQTQDPAPSVAVPEARPRLDPQPDSNAQPTASDIVSSSREMIQLQGQISRRMEDYNKRPRRTFIGARAKESRFAHYLDGWRLKIERVGELNYPTAARGVYGSLLVTVEIRVDGSLEKVEINRSSGHKALDQAALDIVRLAAPFAALPPDIARDTDILSVTRTWTFTRADRFQAD
jgi:protein TonB